MQNIYVDMVVYHI